MVMTLDEYGKLKKKKKSKYFASPIVKKEIRFDSKLEARYYEWLLLEQERGNIKYFLCQVPFRLPGNIKYFVDFQIIMKNDIIKYVDVKGIMTQVSLNKIKQVVSLYPVNIDIVRKFDMKGLM